MILPDMRMPAIAAVSIALAACGGAAHPPPATLSTQAASASPSATALPATSAVSGSLTFKVETGSKAVVRVNEQLADRDLPSDAVLATERVTGQFTLQPDGTFAGSSKIVADITSLASDNRIRDGFIKQTILDTGRFPDATFVPRRTEALALPLPTTGEIRFTLIGDLTIHGVTKSVTLNVVATRSGRSLQATATVAAPLKFGDFGMSQPRSVSVLSVKDEIRLEVQLAATES